jgi:REP element-mobilizing transposase RayT
MLPSKSDEQNHGLQRTRYELRVSGVKDANQNPFRSGIHTRGYLPHVKREGASYFVTFRLADSLPKEVLSKFERERAERLRRLNRAVKAGETTNESEESIKLDFDRILHRYLDKGAGACHLRRPDIADLVARTLRHFHESHYLLRDWVVMPNHVHAVVWPMPNYILGDILKSWKQFISRRAKKILRMGDEPFWQQESYDHWIRSDEEKARISRYIRNNPASAGLCKSPEVWRWSSAWKEGHQSRPHQTRTRLFASRVFKLCAVRGLTACRFGNRRYSRFGNLRYDRSGSSLCRINLLI